MRSTLLLKNILLQRVETLLSEYPSIIRFPFTFALGFMVSHRSFLESLRSMVPVSVDGTHYIGHTAPQLIKLGILLELY